MSQWQGMFLRVKHAWTCLLRVLATWDFHATVAKGKEEALEPSQQSGFQQPGFWITMLGFRIPLAGFRIPKPWIPDSTDQNYLDSGFRITLHGASSLYVLCWSFSKICMRTFAGSGVLGTLHTYLDIFENGEFFPPFSKKIRLQKWRIRIVFGRPHENAKQRKYDSIPHIACLMLVLNDVLHHRIRKPPFSSVHTKTSGQRIQKVSRWRLF